jgi:hypothetical protein
MWGGTFPLNLFSTIQRVTSFWRMDEPVLLLPDGRKMDDLLRHLLRKMDIVVFDPDKEPDPHH